MQYHVPILLNECIEGLNINPNGIYVDLTFGGGGHSKAILSKLDKGKLYCFDQDKDAINNYKLWVDGDEIVAKKTVLVEANFRHFKKFLRLHGVTQVDGILADLGVSSHQFDVADRGFSYRFDADLDMRMNQSQPISAKTILNTYDERGLTKIFTEFGEIQNAWKLANTITRERVNKPIETTGDLTKVCFPLAKKGQDYKYFSQVFQALRIEVNEEMEALKEMLLETGEVIKPKGRLAIITFHSLEDRLVKNYIKQGLLEGEATKDVFGNVTKPFDAVTRKPIEPTEDELKVNSRARSAKLRVAERV
ncbi:MAG: 16S rRNA (cytosine(1402)-N(4))-methyltransferase RsmH [Cytophagales bacterium]